MALFKRGTLPFGNSGYPDSGDTNIYTTPLNKSTVVVGLSVSNTTEFDLPCNVYLKMGGGSVNHYLAKDKLVKAGETVQLIDSGQKVVLKGDTTVSDGLWGNGFTQ